jgi:hypothetical protein
MQTNIYALIMIQTYGASVTSVKTYALHCAISVTCKVWHYVLKHESRCTNGGHRPETASHHGRPVQSSGNSWGSCGRSTLRGSNAGVPLSISVFPTVTNPPILCTNLSPPLMCAIYLTASQYHSIGPSLRFLLWVDAWLRVRKLISVWSNCRQNVLNELL